MSGDEGKAGITGKNKSELQQVLQAIEQLRRDTDKVFVKVGVVMHNLK